MTFDGVALTTVCRMTFDQSRSFDLSNNANLGKVTVIGLLSPGAHNVKLPGPKYLHVSIDEPVELEVFIVVAERVDQLCGDLQGQKQLCESSQVNFLVP